MHVPQIAIYGTTKTPITPMYPNLLFAKLRLYYCSKTLLKKSKKKKTYTKTVIIGEQGSCIHV